MRIIPVIDLKDGVVVRGVAGRRESYRPVQSVLGCVATAKGVAGAFASQFGFQWVYAADLDAIAGAEPNWEAYEAIASAGLRMIVDAGTNCVQRAGQFVARSLDGGWCGGVVVGLESLRREQDLLPLCDTLGNDRAIFSLDLCNDTPLTKIEKWHGAKPVELVDLAVDAGFNRLIVLDLASIGVGEGVSVRTLCATIRSRHPQLEITSGGGVRNRADLAALALTGCDAALVATALHAGRLSREDLSSFG